MIIQQKQIECIIELWFHVNEVENKLILICNKYIITYQINKLMILPPMQEHMGSPKQRKLRMYNNCAHAIDICFIFVILGLFSVFLLHIVLHKTFFFGECKREVIEVLVCCSTLSLFRFFVECGREKKQILMWYLAPIHSFVQHLLLITSRILYKKYQRI